MAKSMYFNRSYLSTKLSTKFKKETGMIISDYIMKEKIEEAKRLRDLSIVCGFLICQELFFKRLKENDRVNYYSNIKECIL